jgi:hypothetical protein
MFYTRIRTRVYMYLQRLYSKYQRYKKKFRSYKPKLQVIHEVDNEYTECLCHNKNYLEYNSKPNDIHIHIPCHSVLHMESNNAFVHHYEHTRTQEQMLLCCGSTHCNYIMFMLCKLGFTCSCIVFIPLLYVFTTLYISTH